MTATVTKPGLIAIADIEPSPHNIRSRLTNLEPLAASIVSVGVLTTCLVVPSRMAAGKQKYRLIEGHRRRAAALIAGKTHLPCMIRQNNKVDETGLMAVANLQRENLDPIDAARAFSDLLERHTMADVVGMTGFSAATIRARVGLLTLPDEAQEMISDGYLSLGDAADLVKSVKEHGSGSARIGVEPGTKRRSKGSHFTTQHPLADHVQARCTHRETNRQLRGPGCEQCWEATIRADALGDLDNVTVLNLAAAPKPFDASAVERAISGDHAGLSLGTGEREEIVRRLVQRKMSDAEIARFAMTTSRTVLRTRNRLGIEPGVAPSQPDQAVTRRRTQQSA